MGLGFRPETRAWALDLGLSAHPAALAFLQPHSTRTTGVLKPQDHNKTSYQDPPCTLK